MSADRRKFLETATAMTAGATVGLVGGCALPTTAHDEAGMMFHIEPAYIPLLGSAQKFPVRRIYCVGRNYAAHSREMGSDPTREPPFFFQKPTDAIQLAPQGTTIDHPYPSITKNYHYEVELVAAIGKRGANIPADKALDFVVGYAVGLDMTRRDLQRMMGDQKKPWEGG